MAKTRKRRQRHRGGDDSSFFSSSSSDEMSAEEAPLPGASDIRAIIINAMRETQVKQTMEIKRMLEEHKDELEEMKEHLKKLTEDHILLRTQLEQLNCSSGDRSLALRAEQNQMKPPRFRLKITSVVKETVETRKNIQTSLGNYIEVNLYDGAKPIAPDHPLASAEIMMVVLNGEFNKDDTQYNWTKEDFNKSIIRPRQGNLASEDENKGIESIVSKCTFYLTGGIHRHSGATIVNNSGNKNVRLGVMLLSHSKERVLEGLSNHFLVRDPPKKSIKQRKAMGYGQEQNGPSSPTYIQTTGNRINVVPEQLAANNMDNTVAVDQPHQIEPINDQQLSWVAEVAEGDYQATISPIGFQFQDHIMFAVQLLWDRPYVLPNKSWNLLDELMPLYNSQTKNHSSNFAALRLMSQHYEPLTTYSQGSYQNICFNDLVSFLTKLMRKLEITTMPEQVMQSHQSRGVLIQPLELDPDDNHDEPPLKRKLHKKYRLQFVNKVCKTYYTWEQIEADNGDLLNIALYDEDNMIVTSGPLSSVSVEIVALHGDFNIAGEDDWTLEDFSSYLVCPRSIKESPVLGGHLILVLANGKACIDSAFFQKTSIYARTERFKMGVMLAGTQDEGVQEGISEPFWVRNRQGKCSTSTQHCPQVADDVYLPGNIMQNEYHCETVVVGDMAMKKSEMDEGIELCLQGINKEAANDIHDSQKQKVDRLISAKLVKIEVGIIIKVAQAIARAARTARRNRSMWVGLADRVENVGDLLRNPNVVVDSATRRKLLDRLREALVDALKLVEASRRKGMLICFSLLPGGKDDVVLFHDIERGIINCLDVIDLSIANDADRENRLAARELARRPWRLTQQEPEPRLGGGQPQCEEERSRHELTATMGSTAGAGHSRNNAW